VSTVNQTDDARAASDQTANARLVLHQLRARDRGWCDELRDCYQRMEADDGA
jgi:hypothetical protein